MRNALIAISILYVVGCSDPLQVTHRERTEKHWTITKSNDDRKIELLEQVVVLLRERPTPQKTPPVDDESRPVVDVSSVAPDQPSPADQGGVEVLTDELQTDELAESTVELANCCDDGRPTLCITYADFNCPPCDKLKADIAAGKLDGFAISYDPAGLGLSDNRPAIRFERETSATGFAVIYGYNDAILAWLKGELLPKTMATAERDTVITIKPVVTQQRVTKPVASQSELISIHNELHGGGSWTWPGGTTQSLRDHLQSVHGYNAGSVVQVSSCPGGNCPVPRRAKYRRR